jgi:hypothetical protein
MGDENINERLDEIGRNYRNRVDKKTKVIF